MCYIYRQRGGEIPRPRCVDRVENSPRVAAVPLVGPGKGQRIILCGLGCTYAEDSPTPCTSLNLMQHNISNTLFVCGVGFQSLELPWLLIYILSNLPFSSMFTGSQIIRKCTLAFYLFQL
jgi:hypothetical protein